MPRDMSPESLRRPSSTEESGSVPQLDNPRTQHVFNSIIKGRKSWKTLRGGEVVWPLDLEAALIEGLENYKPDDSRETRLLGRFPLRNRFISDWIHDKTGQRRTAKQVGSRLQQLRDTCGGKRLANLISPRRPIPARASSSLSPRLPHRASLSSPTSEHEGESCSDSSSASSPTTPTEVHATLQNLLYRGHASPAEPPFTSVVYIDLLLHQGAEDFNQVLDGSLPDEDEGHWSGRGMDIVKIASHPRHISTIDPTITFTSRSPKAGRSLFSLYSNGELVHSETLSLKLLGPLEGNDGYYLHATALLPLYWSRLIQIPNLSQYSIIHRVVEDSPEGSSTTLFSTMYKFRYPSSGASYRGSYSANGLRLDSGFQKDAGLDYAAFNTLLTMPSSEAYHTSEAYSPDSPVYGDKESTLYDMVQDWGVYPGSYHSSH